jgi:hypothetical protein
MKIQEVIKHIAISRLGIQEKPGNQGFQSGEYQRELETIGWKIGWAWCVFAAQEIWEKAYAATDSKVISQIRQYFTPSAVSTLKSFKNNEHGFIVSKEPGIGSIAIWQRYINGKADWRGHAAVVIGHDLLSITTVDGNSNHAGSREGDGIFKKTRELSFDIPEKGTRLVLIGFIHPK